MQRREGTMRSPNIVPGKEVHLGLAMARSQQGRDDSQHCDFSQAEVAGPGGGLAGWEEE